MPVTRKLFPSFPCLQQEYHNTPHGAHCAGHFHVTQLSGPCFRIGFVDLPAWIASWHRRHTTSGQCHLNKKNVKEALLFEGKALLSRTLAMERGIGALDDARIKAEAARGQHGVGSRRSARSRACNRGSSSRATRANSEQAVSNTSTACVKLRRSGSKSPSRAE